MADSLREILQRRFDSLLVDRQSNCDGHWGELAQYILPRRYRTVAGDRGKLDKINGSIIDSTAPRASRTLKSGLMSGLTSPARQWFRLGVTDTDLSDYGPVKAWLFEVAELLRAVFNRSNIYLTLSPTYEDLGVFGTASAFLEDDYEDVLRATSYACGEYVIAQDPQGRVRTWAASREYTVEQVVRRFGLEKCSTGTQNNWRNGNHYHGVEVVRMVLPGHRDDQELGAYRNWPWIGVWWEQGGEADKLLGVGGFYEFPVLTPRWDITGTDAWGRSPGMDALGDVKQLQTQTRRRGQAIDKVVNPPMTAPTSLRGQPASLLPGGITYLDVPSGGQGFAPAYTVPPSIEGLRLDMEETRDRVRNCFYSDLFAMISQLERNQITAYEVAIRQEEKLLLLTPVLERLHYELLQPLIERSYSILERAGLLPPAPPEVGGMPLRIEYLSPLVQAQKAMGLSGLDRMLQITISAASAQPDALDKLDFDEFLDRYAEALGVPPTVIREDSVVAERRSLREKQMAQQQQMAQLQAGAAAAKDLSMSDTSRRNLLTDLSGGAGVV